MAALTGLSERVAKSGFFYGWIIVVLALLSSFWGVGVVQRSMPVVLKPLTEDLNVPRTIGVLGVTLAALTADLAAPFVGRFVDRSGPRLLVVLCAALTGACLIALSQVQTAWLFILLFGGILGLTKPALQAVGAQTTVAKWFIRKRGRAVTYSTLGLPLSAVIIIPLTQWMVANFDWRTAWFVLGLGVWLFLLVPAAFFMRGKPEDMGLLPDGDVEPAGSPPPGGGRRAGPAAEQDWDARDAFRTRAFWGLSLAFAIIGMVPSILTLHMFPYFTDQGLDPATAAAANGSFGLAVMGSRTLFWGYALERLPIQRTLLLWGCLMTGAISLMLLVTDVVWAYAAACSFGIAMGGTAPLGTLAWARYFGRSSLGTITGVSSLIGVVNDVAGPMMPSLVYDFTGSYHGAFIATAIACLFGVAMVVAAGGPKAPPRAPAAVSN